ncbi:hypothetical protein, partial [uncultured Gimesia sp.]|uniref:hypothetical protein n=1 Tax=uncultured Gimesia sp. TaxID=1678688 RepID=UPI0026253C19
GANYVPKRGKSSGKCGLTANVMEGDLKKCIEAGCNAHITKPVNRNHLVHLIAETCDAEPVV